MIASKKRGITFIALAIGLIAASPAYSAVINGTFELGDLSGWTTTTSASASTGNPQSGTTSALVTNGTNDNLGTFTGATIPGTGGGGIQQTFTITVPSTLTFFWDFQTFESTPEGTYNDSSYFVLNGAATLLADTNSTFVGVGTGFSERTGYQSFSTALDPGTHTISFVVTDVADSVGDSGLFIDGVTVISAVPEPSSALFVGLGSLAFLHRIRRRG